MNSGETIGTTTLRNSDGNDAGTASLVARGSSLSVSISATGLTPGQHGFHVHETGRCERPSFTSAGGHLNPSGATHGLFSANGAHLGDLPNLIVDATGKAEASVALTGARRDLIEKIFDADGAAIVVHAGPDDYKTDPAGDAGSRVLCGVLTRAR